MRILRILGMAAIFTFAIAACNQSAEKSETIDLREDGTSEEADMSQTEDDDNSIDIKVKRDGEGNVEGELSGDIKLEDRK